MAIVKRTRSNDLERRSKFEEKPTVDEISRKIVKQTMCDDSFFDKGYFSNGQDEILNRVLKKKTTRATTLKATHLVNYSLLGLKKREGHHECLQKAKS